MYGTGLAGVGSRTSWEKSWYQDNPWTHKIDFHSEQRVRLTVTINVISAYYLAAFFAKIQIDQREPVNAMMTFSSNDNESTFSSIIIVLVIVVPIIVA